MQKVTDILAHPIWYNTLQKLLIRQSIVEQHIKNINSVPANATVLDIGCGTGNSLKYLPKSVHYTGLDYNPQYIKYAKKTHTGHVAFYCHNVKNPILEKLQSSFDFVLIGGVLHHFPDELVAKTLSDAYLYLKPDGLLLVSEPLRTKKMYPIYKFFVDLDRGNFTRSSEAYQKLLQEKFTIDLIYRMSDALRIPYEHVIFKCKKFRFHTDQKKDFNF